MADPKLLQTQERRIHLSVCRTENLQCIEFKHSIAKLFFLLIPNRLPWSKRQDTGTTFSTAADDAYELLLNVTLVRNTEIGCCFLIKEPNVRFCPQAKVFDGNSNYYKTENWQRLFKQHLALQSHLNSLSCGRQGRSRHKGITKNKLSTETVVTADTYSISGQLSGFSSRPPSITKRSTCSLVMPWYGCSANVAISQSTTPKDLENKRTLESQAMFTRIFFFDDAEQVGFWGSSLLQTNLLIFTL